ncbi:hypothetical protein GF326_06130 [Candidatus Bathyarchaeota archaeon]|nr:hypothetical protein [Candidatus Bathyarchaeota archaeon]
MFSSGFVILSLDYGFMKNSVLYVLLVMCLVFEAINGRYDETSVVMS